MTGLARVNRALDKIASEAKLGNGGKIDKAVQLLIDSGVDAARTEYLGSGVEDSDNVRVSGSLTAQEGMVTATGAKILFVEFGTGVNLNYGSMKGGEFGFVPASWSTSDAGKGWLTGKRLARFKGWWAVPPGTPGAQPMTFTSSNGREIHLPYATQGHAPVNAMYHTAEKMKQLTGKFLEAAYK